MSRRSDLYISRNMAFVGSDRLSTIGKVFSLVFVLVVFEGAFRKWVSSELTMPLVILRDLLALYGIFWTIVHGCLQSNRFLMQGLMAWTSVLVIWSLIQMLANAGSFIVLFVGLRFWLLYLWFGFAAASALTKYDFFFILRLILLTVLVTTPLVFYQFISPPGAFINQQVDGDESTVFRLSGDIVRTTGLFSFTLGQTTLLAIAAPVSLATLSVDASIFRENKWLPFVVFFCVAICVLLCGSRSALVTFLFQFIVFMLYDFFCTKVKKNMVQIVSLVGVVLGVFLLPIMLPDAISAIFERVASANDVEDPVDRLISIIFGETSVYERLTFWGYGLGAGTNFVGALKNTEFALGETETTRSIMEAGLFGFLFVALKIIASVVGIFYAIKASNVGEGVLPVLLWVTVVISLFAWPTLGQLTANALGWMFLGLGLAAIKIYLRKGT